MSGEVTFEKSVDDLIGTYRDWFVARARDKPVRRLLRLLAVAALIAFTGWLLHEELEVPPVPFHGAACGLIGGVPICWCVGYALLPQRARRTFAEQRTRNPNWSWSWRWSDAGLSSSNATRDNHYGWDEFHHWVEGRYALLFFLTESHVLYVARRVLSAEQTADLSAIAHRAGIPRG